MAAHGGISLPSKQAISLLKIKIHHCNIRLPRGDTAVASLLRWRTPRWREMATVVISLRRQPWYCTLLWPWEECLLPMLVGNAHETSKGHYIAPRHQSPGALRLGKAFREHTVAIQARRRVLFLFSTTTRKSTKLNLEINVKVFPACAKIRRIPVINHVAQGNAVAGIIPCV